MKVNIDRTKTYELSDKSKDRYYFKYRFEIQRLQAKGVDITPMKRTQFIAALMDYRNQANAKGRYLSNAVKTVVNEQRWEGHLRRNEAIAFRKALKLDKIPKVKDVMKEFNLSYKEAIKYRKEHYSTVSISNIQKEDRDLFIQANKEVLSDFWKSIRGNQKEIDKWNDILGTNYSVDDAADLISYYFFGSP